MLWSRYAARIQLPGSEEEEEEEELGIAQVAVARGEAGLSQALTHLPAGSWPLKAHGAASLRLLWTHPLPRFTPGSDGEKTTMGLFYSKSQVRKGKRRLCNELSRLSLGAEGTCCRR